MSAKRLLELEAERAKGKQEGIEQIIKDVRSVLPLNSFSNQSVAFRVLAKDIEQVLKEFEKKK